MAAFQEESEVYAAEAIAVEPSPVDVWAWTQSASAQLNLSSMRSLQQTVLSNKPARRELDERVDSSEASADDSSASEQRGIALWLRGDYAEAASYLADSASTAVATYIYGECVIHGRQLGRDRISGTSATVAERLAPFEKEDNAYLTLRLRALLAAADEDAAVEALKGAPAAYKASADGTYYAAVLAELAGDYDTAEALFSSVLTMDPNHGATLFHEAARADLSSDDEQAISLYERLASSEPPCLNALMNLGVLYEDNDMYTEAVQCYRRVLAAYPGHPRAILFLKDATASLDMYYDEEQEVRKDKKAQVLKVPVSDFELSVRSRNCLAKMEIITLEDLVRKTESELLSYKNFGETSLKEILLILESKGLRLGMSPEDEIIPAGDRAEEALRSDPTPPPALVDPNDERLTKSVNEMSLSVRSRKCLSTLNINTLGELCSYTVNDLLSQRNFGQTSLNEIMEQLTHMGLSLRTVDA